MAVRWIGAVAQLGERRVRNAEVRGSTPLGSTSVFQKIASANGAAKYITACRLARVAEFASESHGINVRERKNTNGRQPVGS